jgi:hypothetical protein
MENLAPPLGLDLHTRVVHPTSGEKRNEKTFALYALYSLISLDSDEKIQENPTPINWGFQSETAKGQQNPNGSPRSVEVVGLAARAISPPKRRFAREPRARRR